MGVYGVLRSFDDAGAGQRQAPGVEIIWVGCRDAPQQAGEGFNLSIAESRRRAALSAVNCTGLDRAAAVELWSSSVSWCHCVARQTSC